MVTTVAFCPGGLASRARSASEAGTERGKRRA